MPLFYLFIIRAEGRNVLLHMIRCVITSGARISTVHFSDGRSANESWKNCRSLINGVAEGEGGGGASGM